MSYSASYPVYQTHGTNAHRLREFIPTYQVRSDYLPGTVREGNNPQVNELVTIFLFSSEDTKMKEEEVEFSLKDLESLTLTDTYHSLPMSTLQQKELLVMMNSQDFPEEHTDLIDLLF